MRQDDFSKRQPQGWIVIILWWTAIESVARLVSSSEKGSTRGGTERMRYVPIGTRDTVRRQRVDIGCGDIRTAVESDIAVTEVIGEDDHNIRRPIVLRKHRRG